MRTVSVLILDRIIRRDFVIFIIYYLEHESKFHAQKIDIQLIFDKNDGIVSGWIVQKKTTVAHDPRFFETLNPPRAPSTVLVSMYISDINIILK